MEIDLTSGYITEIVAQRSGDLQIQNFMRPSARLLIYAMWPPEAHEFDTLAYGTLYQNFRGGGLWKSDMTLMRKFVSTSEQVKETVPVTTITRATLTCRTFSLVHVQMGSCYITELRMWRH